MARNKRNAAYWAKRFEQLEAAQINKGIDYYNNLSEQYDLAARNVTREIEAWYQRFADEEGISLQAAKKTLAKDELKAFHMDVKEYIRKGKTLNYSDKWKKELERASTKWHISRLDALKLQMQQQVEMLYGNEADGLDQLLQGIYEDGYYHTAYEIQKGVGVGSPLASLDENRISKLLSRSWAADGSNFSERIWGKHRPELINYLNTELTQSIIRGDGPRDLIDSVSRRFDVSKRRAGTLVMTESAYFASASQKDCFSDLGVDRYRIVATLDSRTSEICQEMDGKVFKMSEYEIGVTAPPFHANCRSCTAPYFDDEFASESMRAARGEDGKTYYVPADMTYPEWKDAYLHKSTGILSSGKPGIQGKPSVKFVGKLDMSDPNAIQSELEAFEKSVVSEPVEHAYVILQNGKMYHLTGRQSNVDIEIFGNHLEGAYASHNHPAEETEYSFSNEDMRTFMERKLEVLRGVDEKFIYELTRNAEDLEDSVLNWKTEENFKHAQVREQAKEWKLGYRRWKNDKGRG